MATNPPTPYIPKNPGDLITAEDWNALQVDVKQDIGAEIQTAVGNIKNVDHATDADQLGGQTPDQLTQSILKQAEEILPKRTGYWRSFNRLETGKEKLIKHGLKSFPLVDVYQLDYFQAICSSGEKDATPMWVNFFLYHTSERTIAFKDSTGKVTVRATIEAQDQQPFRVLFSDMLALYNVQYTDTTSLDDLETDFWTAFWKSPNDQFDSDQYCHSPWFEKCCGEQRSVKQLKDRGDWDDIWFKMIPRKTINYPTGPESTSNGNLVLGTANLAQPDPPSTPPNPPNNFDGSVAPTQIQVEQHDFDTVGIKLLIDPTYPPYFTLDTVFGLPASYQHELKVMVLLKV
jgi:hypothetical protein